MGLLLGGGIGISESEVVGVNDDDENLGSGEVLGKGKNIGGGN